MTQQTRSVEERLTRLEALMEAMRDDLREVKARQDANFRWTMGLILGMWATVIAAVLGALLVR